MLVRVVRDEIFEVEGDPDLNDLRDSLMDHCLDSQDVQSETSDDKFTFIPRVVNALTVEPNE